METTNTITFAAFQATGQDMDDIAAWFAQEFGPEEAADMMLADVPGRVYMGTFWIERRPTCGTWFTLAGNGQVEDADLEVVERYLFAHI